MTDHFKYYETEYCPIPDLEIAGFPDLTDFEIDLDFGAETIFNDIIDGTNCYFFPQGVSFFENSMISLQKGEFFTTSLCEGVFYKVAAIAEKINSSFRSDYPSDICILVETSDKKTLLPGSIKEGVSPQFLENYFSKEVVSSLDPTKKYGWFEVNSFIDNPDCLINIHTYDGTGFKHIKQEARSLIKQFIEASSNNHSEIEKLLAEKIFTPASLTEQYYSLTSQKEDLIRELSFALEYYSSLAESNPMVSDETIQQGLEDIMVTSAKIEDIEKSVQMVLDQLKGFQQEMINHPPGPAKKSMSDEQENLLSFIEIHTHPQVRAFWGEAWFKDAVASLKSQIDKNAKENIPPEFDVPFIQSFSTLVKKTVSERHVQFDAEIDAALPEGFKMKQDIRNSLHLTDTSQRPAILRDIKEVGKSSSPQELRGYLERGYLSIERWLRDDVDLMVDTLVRSMGLSTIISDSPTFDYVIYSFEKEYLRMLETNDFDKIKEIKSSSIENLSKGLTSIATSDPTAVRSMLQKTMVDPEVMAIIDLPEAIEAINLLHKTLLSNIKDNVPESEDIVATNDFIQKIYAIADSHWQKFSTKFIEKTKDFLDEMPTYSSKEIDGVLLTIRTFHPKDQMAILELEKDDFIAKLKLIHDCLLPDFSTIAYDKLGEILIDNLLDHSKMTQLKKDPRFLAKKPDFLKTVLENGKKESHAKVFDADLKVIKEIKEFCSTLLPQTTSPDLESLRKTVVTRDPSSKNLPTDQLEEAKKSLISQAGYRIFARKIIKIAHSITLSLLSKSHKASKIKDLLDTKIGAALISLTLSSILNYFKLPQKQAQEVIQELRIEGYLLGAESVLDVSWDSLISILESQTLSNEEPSSKIRLENPSQLLNQEDVESAIMLSEELIDQKKASLSL